MNDPKATYDPDVDCAYITLREGEGIKYAGSEDYELGGAMVIIDHDQTGRVMGVEILSVTKLPPPPPVD